MIILYTVFQLVLYLCVCVVVVVAIQYFLTWYSLRQYQPTVTNVIRYLRRIPVKSYITDAWSESEVEQFFARQLNKKFAKVATQSLIGGTQYARERIDIDLNNGKLGIEIKLANMLRKSNERNRLLGQIDLYLARKYSPEALLVLIVGSKQNLTHAHITEIQRIIESKKVACHYVEIN